MLKIVKNILSRSKNVTEKVIERLREIEKKIWREKEEFLTFGICKKKRRAANAAKRPEQIAHHTTMPN